MLNIDDHNNMRAQGREPISVSGAADSLASMAHPLPIRSNSADQNTLNEIVLRRYNQADNTLESVTTNYREVSSNRAVTDRMIAQILQQNRDRAGDRHEHIYNIRNQPAVVNQAVVPNGYQFGQAPLQSIWHHATTNAPVPNAPLGPTMPPMPTNTMVPIMQFASNATEIPVSHASAAQNTIHPIGWIVPAQNTMQMPMHTLATVPPLQAINLQQTNNHMPLHYNQANAQNNAAANVPPRLISGRDDSRIPIHHWKTYFSGDENKTMKNEMNIHDFLSQVECYRIGENMSEDQLLRKIPHLLIGSARTWFNLHRHSILVWSEFVDQLKRRFLSADYNYQLYLEAQNRRQGKNEPIGNYIADMQSKFRAMSNPPDAQHRLYLVRINMLYEHSMALATQSVDFIEQLEMLVKQRESAKACQMNYRKQFGFARPAVNEVQLEGDKSPENTDSDSNEELCALMRAITNRVDAKTMLNQPIHRAKAKIANRTSNVSIVERRVISFLSAK